MRVPCVGSRVQVTYIAALMPFVIPCKGLPGSGKGPCAPTQPLNCFLTKTSRVQDQSHYPAADRGLLINLARAQPNAVNLFLNHFKSGEQDFRDHVMPMPLHHQCAVTLGQA